LIERFIFGYRGQFGVNFLALTEGSAWCYM